MPVGPWAPSLFRSGLAQDWIVLWAAISVACTIFYPLLLFPGVSCAMDLQFLLPYLVLCFLLWSEWDLAMDTGPLSFTTAMRTDSASIIGIGALVATMFYSRDLFLVVFLFLFSRYIAMYIDMYSCAVLICIVGCLSWMPTTATGCAHIFGAAILCADDILLAYIRCATAIFSYISGMAAHMSKITMKAIRSTSLLRVYRAMAVLSIAILATYLIYTFLFCVSIITVVYEHWQSIVSSPFFGALFGIYIWVPVTWYMFPHLLGI